ncbi:MAG: hypothetical protein CMC15_14450 [Flavobacteriaceae bacterium]|nr:hypothetical protein [Flavobacteriaceae bacterium]
MDHGKKKKMGHGGVLMMKAEPKREKAAMGRRTMYMEGGKAEKSAQPVYGSTIEDAMPRGMAN